LIIYNLLCNISEKKEVNLNKKGFTLIELIVTIGLLIILLSIVFPKINLDRYYMDKVAKELLYDLKDIKVKMMTTDGPAYSMTISEDHYMLKIGKDKRIYQYKKFELKEGYKFIYSYQDVAFNFNGAPHQSQTIRILNTETNEIREISIVLGTGRILLLE